MNNKKCSCGGAQFDYAGRCLACRREKSPMNKTTPDKEKLREEWMNSHFVENVDTNYNVLTNDSPEEIADWWLDKMEAQKAELIALIEGMKKAGGVCALDINTKLCAKCQGIRSHNAALNDILSILRKEI